MQTQITQYARPAYVSSDIFPAPKAAEARHSREVVSDMLSDPKSFPEYVEKASPGHDIGTIMARTRSSVFLIEHYSPDGRYSGKIKQLNSLFNNIWDKVYNRTEVVDPVTGVKYTATGTFKEDLLNKYRDVQQDAKKFYEASAKLANEYHGTGSPRAEEAGAEQVHSTSAKFKEEALALTKQAKLLWYLFSDEKRPLKDIYRTVIDEELVKKSSEIKIKGNLIDHKVPTNIYTVLALNEMKNYGHHGTAKLHIYAEKKKGEIRTRIVNFSQKVPENEKLGTEGYSTKVHGIGGKGLCIEKSIAQFYGGSASFGIRRSHSNAPVFVAEIRIPEDNLYRMEKAQKAVQKAAKAAAEQKKKGMFKKAVEKVAKAIDAAEQAVADAIIPPPPLAPVGPNLNRMSKN